MDDTDPLYQRALLYLLLAGHDTGAQTRLRLQEHFNLCRADGRPVTAATLLPRLHQWFDIAGQCHTLSTPRLVEHCAVGGSQALSAPEITLLCEHPEALRALHYRVWQAAPGTPWGRVRDCLAQTPERHPEPTGIGNEEMEQQWVEVAS